MKNSSFKRKFDDKVQFPGVPASLSRNIDYLWMINNLCVFDTKIIELGSLGAVLYRILLGLSANLDPYRRGGERQRNGNS